MGFADFATAVTRDVVRGITRDYSREIAALAPPVQRVASRVGKGNPTRSIRFAGPIGSDGFYLPPEWTVPILKIVPNGSQWASSFISGDGWRPIRTAGRWNWELKLPRPMQGESAYAVRLEMGDLNRPYVVYPVGPPDPIGGSEAYLIDNGVATMASGDQPYISQLSGTISDSWVGRSYQLNLWRSW